MTAVIKHPIQKSKAKKSSSAKLVDNSAIKKAKKMFKQIPVVQELIAEGKGSAKYSVETTYTGKQISISKGKIVIRVDITEELLFIHGHSGKEFIFKNGNNSNVVKLWEDVIGCLSVAVQEIKKQRKL